MRNVLAQPVSGLKKISPRDTIGNKPIFSKATQEVRTSG